MSNGDDAVNNFSNNQKALSFLDKLLVTREFSTEDREYIRFILIPMLTSVVENMDDGFNEEVRDMATNLCMKLIPYDQKFLRFVEDWIVKKKHV